eukprot:6422430-Pyramimonas_sp.AAC.2
MPSDAGMRMRRPTSPALPGERQGMKCARLILTFLRCCGFSLAQAALGPRAPFRAPIGFQPSPVMHRGAPKIPA